MAREQTNLHVKIPVEMHRELTEHCKARGVGVSNTVRVAIATYLKAHAGRAPEGEIAETARKFEQGATSLGNAVSEGAAAVKALAELFRKK